MILNKKRNYFRGSRYGIAAAISVVAFVGLGVLFFLLLYGLSTPSYFEAGKIMTVSEGSTVREVVEDLKEEGVIRSRKIALFYMRTVQEGESIIAGDYLFERPMSVFHVMNRLVTGNFGDSRIRVTFPEGIDIEDMGDILAEKMEGLTRSEFVRKAEHEEGYLFPDTYFFFPTTTVGEIIEVMQDRFYEVVEDYEEEIVASGRSLDDIIKMASIVDREAYGKSDSPVISGILWKRLDKGMHLQVDATFAYTINKASHQLTKQDLKSDSEYNTYVHLGLPPTPIGNPGEVAIRAAIRPKESAYWYYLHDSNGAVHYGRNFEEHKANKRLYLR